MKYTDYDRYGINKENMYREILGKDYTYNNLKHFIYNRYALPSEAESELAIIGEIKKARDKYE